MLRMKVTLTTSPLVSIALKVFMNMNFLNIIEDHGTDWMTPLSTPPEPETDQQSAHIDQNQGWFLSLNLIQVAQQRA